MQAFRQVASNGTGYAPPPCKKNFLSDKVVFLRFTYKIVNYQRVPLPLHLLEPCENWIKNFCLSIFFGWVCPTPPPFYTFKNDASCLYCSGFFVQLMHLSNWIDFLVACSSSSKSQKRYRKQRNHVTCNGFNEVLLDTNT